MKKNEVEEELCKTESVSENEIIGQTQSLEEIVILGLWKLESRSTNGITAMSIPLL